MRTSSTNERNESYLRNRSITEMLSNLANARSKALRPKDVLVRFLS